jgi:hypothetical protein
LGNGNKVSGEKNVILSDSEESTPSRSGNSHFGAKTSLFNQMVGILHSASLHSE